MEYQFELFADYFQMYLYDESNLPDFTHWTPQAVADLILAAPDGVAIGTVRNMTVPLSVELLDAQPDEDFTGWDHVTQTGIDVSSGRLAVCGCTDPESSVARIPVAPGTYCVRLYYGGLDTLSENGLDGGDHYKAVLWPGQCEGPAVLKRRAAVPG